MKPLPPCDVIILAAGQGRRLRSNAPKALAPLAEKPLLAHVLTAVQAMRPRRVVVVVTPHAAEVHTVARAVCPAARFAVQQTPRGTADAAAAGLAMLANDGAAVILCADTPMLTAASMRRLHRQATGLALLTCHANNPKNYGRIVRDQGRVVAIVEEKDADARIRAVSEVFAGALAAPTRWLKKTLRRVHDDNKAKERYLTDLAVLAVGENRPIATVTTAEAEAAGVNTATDLAAAEEFLRRRRADELLARGVFLADPRRVDVRGRVRAAADVFIDVNVVFIGDVVLGRGCRIDAHCVIADCTIGANTHIQPFCHLQNARLGESCSIGPFARLRVDSRVEDGVRVGNFVEVKNSRLATGAKAGHLAYLGDADIGGHANIGAGVITCNYDGRKKHRTIIGDNAFIGSDVQLVAPVRVGDGAYIAAGTTLTKDAPPKQLTISRMRQLSFSRDGKTAAAQRQSTAAHLSATSRRGAKK